ncbi:LIC_10190 family membrane protein [Hymenobacter aerophilus]|uniref:LIC_10190 family membrane protein n=1 Tax=Hymenobacter aerophilus TaxID=119644 RepID=UPI00038060C1|nr:hypothetical protein [Hymenobacter aerophilus]
MLLILGSWLLLALVTTTLGWSAWRAVTARRPAPLPVEVLSLAGVALLTAGLAPVSLVLPLGSWVVRGGLAVLVVALLLGQRQAVAMEWHRWRTAPRPAAWWTGAALLALLLLALLLYQQLGSGNPDAQLYYLQTLHWLQDYSVIPGLGNLHGRLAFNSHLFLATAVFSIPTPTGTYYPLPPYLGVLLAVAAVRGVVRGMRGFGAAWAWAGLLLFCVHFYVFRGWLASPAPDCAVIIFLNFIFLLYSGFFGPYNVQGSAGRPRLILLALLSGVAVTIKLSALPVLLLPLHALWVAQRPAAAGGAAAGLNHKIWPAALPLLGLATVVFLPWLIRNLVLSGYPIYPLPGLPGLPVDWRMPPELVLDEQRIVTNVARSLPHANWHDPVETRFQQWVPRWWHYEAPGSPLLLAVKLIAIAPLIVWWRARRTTVRLDQLGWLSAWLVAAVGGVFWFTLAPDYRFGAGFLVVLAFWPWLTLPPLPRWLGVLLLAGAGAGLLNLLRDPIYALRHPRPEAVAALFWPNLPPLPPTHPVRLPKGHVVHVANEKLGACGETPLPCTHAIVPGLELRGESLAEGFRIVPPTPVTPH